MGRRQSAQVESSDTFGAIFGRTTHRLETPVARMTLLLDSKDTFKSLTCTIMIIKTVTDAAGMVILKMVMNIAVFTVVEEDVGEDGAVVEVAVVEGGHVVLLAVDRIAPTTTTKR